MPDTSHCCCDIDCETYLCVRTMDRCTELLREDGSNIRTRYVASTVTFDGPDDEHHVIETGGGGRAVAQACVGDLAPGEWTVTVEADGFKTQTADVTVVECESLVVRVQLCPEKVVVWVRLTGCVPPASCGAIMVELTGPGVITPSGPVDLRGSDTYLDAAADNERRFEVDLSAVDVDADCTVPLTWSATITPPEGLGLSPVSGDSPGATDGCAEHLVALEFATPEGKVCCGGILRPETLEFSDDWGSCTLTHGAECNIEADWVQAGYPLRMFAPWVGHYSFTCSKGCSDDPCYGGDGNFTGELAVTVTIAAECPGGKIYKIFDVCSGCDGDAGIRSKLPTQSNTFLQCRLVGSTASVDDCDDAVLASGSWSRPSQALPCMGSMPGFTGTPCVFGGWTLTG
jgi:hypothetical protein